MKAFVRGIPEPPPPDITLQAMVTKQNISQQSPWRQWLPSISLPSPTPQLLPSLNRISPILLFELHFNSFPRDLLGNLVRLQGNLCGNIYFKFQIFQKVKHIAQICVVCNCMSWQNTKPYLHNTKKCSLVSLKWILLKVVQFHSCHQRWDLKFIFKITWQVNTPTHQMVRRYYILHEYIDMFNYLQP